MAGYLFNLDSDRSLEDSFRHGMYSTRLSDPGNGVWRIHHEGTFADFSSMKAGDNIYFFIDRKIYGIGELVDVDGDCKYQNYPGANVPVIYNYNDIKAISLFDSGDESTSRMRFVCFFKPSPDFYLDGVDMDEVLASSPAQFKMIRAFWKLSFIKFSDDENQALKNIILRRNFRENEPALYGTYAASHNLAQLKISENKAGYALDVSPFLGSIANEDGSLRHEMAVEAGLIFQLSSHEKSAIDCFGAWDYLSHQVIASPFKPIDYMDKMDLFGYRFIAGQSPTISKYMVAELKKDQVVEQDVLQLMKYVDWVNSEYAYGDYSMIQAFLVGSSFSNDVIRNYRELTERKYIHGVRPAVSSEWSAVKLVSYKYDSDSGLLKFSVIE